MGGMSRSYDFKDLKDYFEIPKDIFDIFKCDKFHLLAFMKFC